MSDRKISQLRSVSNIEYNDVIPIVQNGTTYKVSIDQLVALGSKKILMQESFNAISRMSYLVSTAVADITATLPAEPLVGDYITFADPFVTWNSSPFTINNNNKMIHGLSEPLICNVKGLTFTLTYVGESVGGTNMGWRVD